MKKYRVVKITYVDDRVYYMPQVRTWYMRYVNLLPVDDPGFSSLSNAQNFIEEVKYCREIADVEPIESE